MRIRRAPRHGPDPTHPGEGILRCGQLTLDLGAHLALAGDRPLSLSHLQFVVLTALVRGEGRVVATRELLRAAATAVVPSERTIPAVISRLRRELQREAGLPSIVVVRARGYRVVAPATRTDNRTHF